MGTIKSKTSYTVPWLAGLLLLLAAAPAHADPTGGDVVEGSGTISQNGSTTTINQTSHNLIIHWDSFNIGANETVTFNQPGSTAAALNRIFSQNPSQIFGALNANGQILLINPYGIIFSESAHVNVGSLFATSMNITDEDFLNEDGQWHFTTQPGDPNGVVINHGLLRAANGGSINLFGSAVRNTGLIIANYGHINLGAGKTATVDFDGDGLIRFVVSGAVLENNQQLESAVSNTGTLQATSGHILMTANVAQNIFAQAVNNTGVIKANGVSHDGGVVRLVGEGGNVLNSGDIQANSAQANAGVVWLESSHDTVVRNGTISTVAANGEGGDIRILGDRVGLFGSNTINASGATGGGNINIGGGYQGSNPELQNSSQTVISADTTINADAIQNGDGGRVIVWSDGSTQYYGDISARGGEQNGNGGFAEVSGKESLHFAGTVDLTAAFGVTGTLLLDPKNIIIDTTGTGTIPPDGILAFSDSPTGNVTISNTTLVTALNTANVVLQANNDITVDAIIDARLNSGDFGLTLQAGRSIFINADIFLRGAFTATINDAGAQAANRDSGLPAIFDMAD
ncbi:MAG TPA: filamentous hemagglutinin N-terminal domain-containing protein, partial [Gammaproteobacteria bacterium]|nr:filamentous hemagglutinin N-terminal domain-containing protein [Gammaproteobacteria bacterium]